VCISKKLQAKRGVSSLIAQRGFALQNRVKKIKLLTKALQKPKPYQLRNVVNLMIDFEEEISKYKPILGIDDVESSIQTDEIKDMMDLLQYITDQASGRRRKGKI